MKQSAFCRRHVWQLVMLVAATLMSCKPGADDLIIIAYGPDKVIAGQEFNRQPDGSNAIWMNVRNATPHTVIVLGRTKLATVVVDNGTRLAAAVPPRLTKSPGDYVLYLMDTDTGKKSLEAVFTVMPEK